MNRDLYVCSLFISSIGERNSAILK
jgi:hypothetical protein